MKTLFLILFGVLSLSIQAQTYFEESNQRIISIEAIPTANRTVYGWKYGVRVGLNINNKWNAGYTRIQNSGSSETAQNVYSGAYFQRALNPKSRLVIIPTLKVGFYDGMCLAVQPTIEGNYKLTKNTKLMAGYGRVDGFPSFDLGFKFDLTRIR